MASRVKRGANIVTRREARVCFVPDTMCESFMAGLIYRPNETDKWEEVSRRKNSALACKLRTATQRWGSWEGYSEDECEFAVVVMISLMQTEADKFITVFSRKVTPVQSIIF